MTTAARLDFGTKSETMPLVMLPGTLCDRRVFAPMLACLAQAQPALAHNTSIIHADMTSHANAHALARHLLDSAPPRFIAVGFSLGAIVALEMALIAPDRVAGMVLLAGNARDVPVADHASRRAMAAIAPDHLIRDTLWPRYTAPARRHDDALRTLVMDMAMEAPLQTLARQTELALTRSDKRPHLGAMTMPALVLGGAWDAVAPPALQEELARGLPRATWRMAPEAGHFLPLECPDFCASALAEWLASTFALS